MGFGDILEGVGSVLDTPRRLLYQGGNALARAGGYEGPEISHFADALGAAGMDRDSLLTKGLGLAGDVATDPLTYLGGAAVKYGAKALSGAAGAAKSGGLLNLRRGFAMAHDVDPATGVAGAILGGSPEAKLTAEAAGHLLPDTGNLGHFFPGESAGASLAGVPRSVGRHEAVHGLVDQIAQGASGEGAPAMVKMAGWLKRGDPTNTTPGLRGGLALLADEAAAHTLENRGGLEQAKGLMNFLFNPNSAGRAGYAADFGRKSALVGAGYRALPAAGAAGAAGAGYLGAKAGWDALGG